ncbi:MAG TPA: SEC-C metal-binding domain-containing protein [Planctomycetaceae bacterium]|nr:SEC-C metal-binding domain-containing protein [Planctomycetaceae bacterium]
MPIDAYDQCPCGSGKKFKFCCHRVTDEIEKVAKLLENHQPRAALQITERVEKQFPEVPWAPICGALVLLEDDEPQAARQKLEALLQAHPEHPYGLALFAAADLRVSGLPAAWPAVYRAFQRAAEVAPDVIAGLALGIAGEMYRRDHFLAARQHLALALRVLRERAEQDVFMRLLQFDSNQDIYYPLRSVHELASCAAEGQLGREIRKASALAQLGCWGPAARVFARAAEEDPQNAGLWQNVGLCRAWDGDDHGAAQALHQAARLLDGDFEAAVELETLGQLLDLITSEDRVRVLSAQYRVQSVSRLLTQLQKHERLVRMQVQRREDNAEPTPAGTFRILDRPQLDELPDGARPQDLPLVVAHLSIYDADPAGDEPPFAFISGLEGEALDAARQLFESAAAGLAVPMAGEDALIEVDTLPRELQPLQGQRLFPADAPGTERRRLEDANWQRLIDDVWSHQPLAALNGISPREAATNPAMRLSLAAAIFVLDAYGDRGQYSLDVPRLRQQFGIEPPRPFDLAAQTPLANVSVMQMSRLPVDRLSDEQLVYTFNRALLIYYGRFLYAVLKELASRTSCHDRVDLNRAYLTLVDLCRTRFDRQEAFHWLEQGRQASKNSEKAFELALQWDMRELMLRLDDPSDPEIQPLAERIKRAYGPKLPNIRQYVESLLYLHHAGPLPASMSEMAASESSTAPVETGRIWTPSEVPAGEPGESKLWIPGRD